MANVLFSFPPFHFHDAYVPDHDSERMKRLVNGKQEHPKEDLAELNPSFSELVSYQAQSGTKGVHLSNQPSDPMVIDHFDMNASSPRLGIRDSCYKIGNMQKPDVQPLSMGSLELLSNYWTVLKKWKREEPGGETNHEILVSHHRKLSTEEIMRVAGTRYIQFQDQRDNYFSMLTHPFASTFSGLSEEDMKEVELAQLLLAAAEKVGDHQFDRASLLLSYCELLASKRASSAQRIVLCFAEALRERIGKETGRLNPSSFGEIGKELDEINQGFTTNLTTLTCYKQLPFVQVAHFASVQSIIENTALVTKIHLIDLGIRSGIQWIVLMQALKERKGEPLELLKITAIGSTSRENLEEAGKRLISAAHSMELPFSFHAVPVPNLEDVREELLNIEDGEAVAVYATMVLRTMLSRSSSLEKLVRVIRNLNPSVMVMTEVEANHNSPLFVERFIEALFFYSAYFDSLETCMSQEKDYKMIMEDTLGNGIRNIIATEGQERIIRNVKMDVWRAFFARYGMVEIGFSEASLYQASLVAKQFTSCTLEQNSKCLLVGWKGTPLHSLSAWKFR